MNTRQMQQFLETYRCASFNKASQNLFISRTALQSSMVSLEEELGQALFVRSANGITLTDFGQKFLGVARQVLSLCDGLLTDSPLADADHLTVSGSHLSFVADLFTEQFAELHGSVSNFRYVQTDRKQICEDVIEGVADLGIVALPSYYRNIKENFFKENGLDYFVIGSATNYCMVGPNSPLYHKQEDHVALHELAPYFRIQYDEPQLTETPDANLQPLSSPSPSPYPCLGKLHVNDSGNCRSMLAQTNCYHIGLGITAKGRLLNILPDVRYLEVSDYALTYDILWIKRGDRELSPVMKRFLRSIYDTAEKSYPDILL